MKDRHLESKNRLEHILYSIEKIEEFVQYESLESFSSNDLINNAVLYLFSVVGEALIHVEPQKLAKYDYPWYKVRSFRNMIAHEYFNIKLSSVWAVVIDDLPELKEVIQSMLLNEF